MTEDYRQKQMVRMQKGTCSEEGCIIYSEMLTDFELIGDHILNIGQEMGMGKVGAQEKRLLTGRVICEEAVDIYEYLSGYGLWH